MSQHLYESSGTGNESSDLLSNTQSTVPLLVPNESVPVAWSSPRPRISQRLVCVHILHAAMLLVNLIILLVGLRGAENRIGVAPERVRLLIFFLVLYTSLVC